MYNHLTENENFVLTHLSMFGSDAYPLRKLRGNRWLVEGIRGCGSCPLVFKTKREATAQWEAYYGLLVDRAAQRLS